MRLCFVYLLIPNEHIWGARDLSETPGNFGWKANETVIFPGISVGWKLWTMFWGCPFLPGWYETSENSLVSSLL